MSYGDHIYYLEVESPTIGALRDALRQEGLDPDSACVAGATGFEVHLWHDRMQAQFAADRLGARGCPATVHQRV
jgi:hypothetical protein